MNFSKLISLIIVSLVLFALLYYYHRWSKKRLLAHLESMGISGVRPEDELEDELLVGSWGSIPVHVLNTLKGRRGGNEIVRLGLGIPNIKELSIVHSDSEVGYVIQCDDPKMRQTILQNSRCLELIASYIQAREDRIDMKECMITAARLYDRGTNFDQVRATLSEQFALVQAIRAALEPFPEKTSAANFNLSVCPFCRGTLSRTYIVECSACKTLHHDVCWTQNEGCSIFGCKGKPFQIAVQAKEPE